MTSSRSPSSWIRLLVVACAVAGATLHAGVPDWLAAASQPPTPPNVGDAGALVLLDDSHLTVRDDGSTSLVHRRAVRILTPSGVDQALASVIYLEKNDRVRVNIVWLVRDDHVLRTYRGTEWFDLNAVTTASIAAETRIKTLSLSDQVIPGDVFGYEVRVDEAAPLFAQFLHPFDEQLPVVAEKFGVELPARWRLDSHTGGPAALIATHSADGRAWSWEWRDQPARPPEPWSAPDADVAATVYGSFLAPTDSKARRALAFATWDEVARWHDTLSAGQCDSDATIGAKAHAITANCNDRLEKIHALCRYAQSLSYISINRDLGIGFGYRPRKASAVIGTGYGDCKDMTNALRALLREAGIASHLLLTRADGEIAILPQWPSPKPFNHAIIGIEAGDAPALPAIVSGPRCGRLILFDPTDPFTPFGRVSRRLQGRLALVTAADGGDLLTIPVLPPAADELSEQTLRLILAANGSASGRYRVIAHGQAAALLRARLRDATSRRLEDIGSSRLTKSLAAARVTHVVPNDEPAADRCTLEGEITIGALAQPMSGTSEIVRVDLLRRGDLPTFSEVERQRPLELHPIEQHDDLIMELPAGWSVDECPSNVTLESPFGRLACVYETSAGQLHFRRTFSVTPGPVPVAQYGAWRKFLSDAARTDRAAFLLRKS